MNANFQRTTQSNIFDCWSEGLDSNQRPLGPKPSALPGCATFRCYLSLAPVVSPREATFNPFKECGWVVKGNSDPSLEHEGVIGSLPRLTTLPVCSIVLDMTVLSFMIICLVTLMGFEPIFSP